MPAAAFSPPRVVAAMGIAQQSPSSTSSDAQRRPPLPEVVAKNDESALPLQQRQRPATQHVATAASPPIPPPSASVLVTASQPYPSSPIRQVQQPLQEAQPRRRRTGSEQALLQQGAVPQVTARVTQQMQSSHLPRHQHQQQIQQPVVVAKTEPGGLPATAASVAVSIKDQPITTMEEKEAAYRATMSGFNQQMNGLRARWKTALTALKQSSRRGYRGGFLATMCAPTRSKTQIDFAIDEATWLAVDFHEERKWKVAVAKQLAVECCEIRGIEKLATLQRTRRDEEYDVEAAARSLLSQKKPAIFAGEVPRRTRELAAFAASRYPNVLVLILMESEARRKAWTRAFAHRGFSGKRVGSVVVRALSSSNSASEKTGNGTAPTETGDGASEQAMFQAVVLDCRRTAVVPENKVVDKEAASRTNSKTQSQPKRKRGSASEVRKLPATEAAAVENAEAKFVVVNAEPFFDDEDESLVRAFLDGDESDEDDVDDDDDDIRRLIISELLVNPTPDQLRRRQQPSSPPKPPPRTNPSSTRRVLRPRGDSSSGPQQAGTTQNDTPRRSTSPSSDESSRRGKDKKPATAPSSSSVNKYVDSKNGADRKSSFVVRLELSKAERDTYEELAHRYRDTLSASRSANSDRASRRIIEALEALRLSCVDAKLESVTDILRLFSTSGKKIVVAASLPAALLRLRRHLATSGLVCTDLLDDDDSPKVLKEGDDAPVAFLVSSRRFFGRSPLSVDLDFVDTLVVLDADPLRKQETTTLLDMCRLSKPDAFVVRIVVDSTLESAMICGIPEDILSLSSPSNLGQSAADTVEQPVVVNGSEKIEGLNSRTEPAAMDLTEDQPGDVVPVPSTEGDLDRPADVTEGQSATAIPPSAEEDVPMVDAEPPLPEELVQIKAMSRVVSLSSDSFKDESHVLAPIAIVANSPLDAVLFSEPGKTNELFMPCSEKTRAYLSSRLCRAARRIETDRLDSLEKSSSEPTDSAKMEPSASPVVQQNEHKEFFYASSHDQARTMANRAGGLAAPVATEACFDISSARPPLRDSRDVVHVPEWLHASRHSNLTRMIKYNVQTPAAATTKRLARANKSALYLKATGISANKLLLNTQGAAGGSSSEHFDAARDANTAQTRHSSTNQRQMQPNVSRHFVPAPTAARSHLDANGGVATSTAGEKEGNRPREPPFDPRTVPFEDVKKAAPELVTAWGETERSWRSRVELSLRRPSAPPSARDFIAIVANYSQKQQSDVSDRSRGSFSRGQVSPFIQRRNKEDADGDVQMESPPATASTPATNIGEKDGDRSAPAVAQHPSTVSAPSPAVPTGIPTSEDTSAAVSPAPPEQGSDAKAAMVPPPAQTSRDVTGHFGEVKVPSLEEMRERIKFVLDIASKEPTPAPVLDESIGVDPDQYKPDEEQFTSDEDVRRFFTESKILDPFQVTEKYQQKRAKELAEDKAAAVAAVADALKADEDRAAATAAAWAAQQAEDARLEEQQASTDTLKLPTSASPMLVDTAPSESTSPPPPLPS